MVKITIEKKRTILFLTLIIFAHCLIFISNTSWNFEKGGADWPQSCKDGNQAPIDISAPFTYKRKIKKRKIKKLKNKKSLNH